MNDLNSSLKYWPKTKSQQLSADHATIIKACNYKLNSSSLLSINYRTLTTPSDSRPGCMLQTLRKTCPSRYPITQHAVLKHHVSQQSSTGWPKSSFPRHHRDRDLVPGNEMLAAPVLPMLTNRESLFCLSCYLPLPIFSSPKLRGQWWFIHTPMYV